MTERAETSPGADEFRILDAAVPPAFPAGPNKARVIAFALLIALLCAFAAALAAHQLDTSFHSVDDIRAFTSVPVLASIPRIVTTRDSYARFLRRVTFGTVAAGVLLALAGVSYRAAGGFDQVARLLMRMG